MSRKHSTVELRALEKYRLWIAARTATSKLRPAAYSDANGAADKSVLIVKNNMEMLLFAGIVSLYVTKPSKSGVTSDTGGNHRINNGRGGEI
jgi:hypothetical protein